MILFHYLNKSIVSYTGHVYIQTPRIKEYRRLKKKKKS